MRTDNAIRPVAQLTRGFTTLLLILWAIIAIQLITLESAWFFWFKPTASPATAQGEPTAEEIRIQRIQYAEKQFLPDGTLHLVATVDGHRWRSSYTAAPPGAKKLIYDVNDRIIWEGTDQEAPHSYLTWASDIRPDSFRQYNMNSVRAIVDASTLQIPVATEERLLAAWRYCPWSNCFVGHDLENRSTGYLGATGPATSKKEAEPFGPFGGFLAWWPADSYSPTLLWRTDRRIYQIHFAEQQVNLVFESPESNIDWVYIQQWDSYRANAANMKNARSLLHCQTENDKHYLILTNPDRTIAVTTPSEWNQWLGNHFEFSVTGQDIFMRRNWVEYAAPTQRKNSDWWAQFRATAKTQWVELYRVSGAGQLERLNRFSWTIPAQEQRAPQARGVNPRAAIQPNVNAFSPLLSDLVWSAGMRRYKSEHREIGEIIKETRPGYRFRHWVVTAIMLILTFLHIRSRKASKATIVFWLVLVGLLNLAGFLTYWALNHTPTIKCSACGRRRGLQKIDCVRCGTPLPIPEHGRLDLIPG